MFYIIILHLNGCVIWKCCVLCSVYNVIMQLFKFNASWLWIRGLDFVKCVTCYDGQPRVIKSYVSCILTTLITLDFVIIDEVFFRFWLSFSCSLLKILNRQYLLSSCCAHFMTVSRPSSTCVYSYVSEINYHIGICIHKIAITKFVKTLSNFVKYGTSSIASIELQILLIFSSRWFCTCQCSINFGFKWEGALN